MKTTRRISKPGNPPDPLQPRDTAPDAEEQHGSSGDSLQLSPERINQGASTTTTVLHEILARDEGTGYLRNWGINE